MHISYAEPKHIPQLFTLFRSFYPKHNIFHQEMPVVSKYLSQKAQKHPFLVLQEAKGDQEVVITAASFFREELPIICIKSLKE